VLFRDDMSVCLVDFNRAQECGAVAAVDWDADQR
jgi:hypothetical protein